jgi:hypothetical protein
MTLLSAWIVVDNVRFGLEKEFVLAVPFLVWSLVFLLAFVFCWWRKSPFGRSLGIAATVATGCLVFAGIVLFGPPWLWFH